MSSEWPVVRLGDLVSIRHGWPFKSEYFQIDEGQGSTLPIVVAIGNFEYSGGFRFHATQVKRYTDAFPSEFVLKAGDILLVMTCQTAGGEILGIPAKVPDDGRIYLHNQRLGLVVFRSDKISPEFAYWLFLSQNFNRHLVGTASGTKILHTAPSRIEAFQFLLPPLNEQLEISAVLSVIDDRITLLRETNATLEAIAQALFKSWFVDFDPVRAKMEGRVPEDMDEATAALFPDGFEESELGEVPRGWRWGTLSDLATFQNGYAFKSKDWTDVGHPVVKIGDVKPGIIDLEGCSYVARETVAGLDRFRLSRGDLLVGMTGYVGETGLVPSVEPAAYLNQRVGRMATKSGASDLGYLYCAARSQAFKEFAEAQSHGSAQANVSGASLMAFPAVIAPPPLMECFNSVMADMLEGILTNHEQARTLSTVRDTLLPRLISGQLHVGEVPEVEHA